MNAILNKHTLSDAVEELLECKGIYIPARLIDVRTGVEWTSDEYIEDRAARFECPEDIARLVADEDTEDEAYERAAEIVAESIDAEMRDPNSLLIDNGQIPVFMAFKGEGMRIEEGTRGDWYNWAGISHDRDWECVQDAIDGCGRMIDFDTREGAEDYVEEQREGRDEDENE